MVIGDGRTVESFSINFWEEIHLVTHKVGAERCEVNYPKSLEYTAQLMIRAHFKAASQRPWDMKICEDKSYHYSPIIDNN